MQLKRNYCKTNFSKLIYVRFLLGFMLCIAFGAEAQNNEPKHTEMEFDGIEREYILYLPEDLPNNAPLVMVFHGYSGSAAYANSYFDMKELADKNGFAVVYPQGTKDQLNNAFWQVGYKSHKSLEVNDVAFVEQLAARLQKEHSLDKANTFIVGFSNGGDLCNKLLCERPDLFKAAAPIISCMMDDMYTNCTNVKGKPILMLNGTKDNITYWAGDMEDKQGYGPYHSTESMLALRIAQNQAVLSSSEIIPSGSQADPTSITLKKYDAKDSNNKVWMYQVNGGGHGHPDYLNLQEHVWAFFSLYLD